MEESKAHPHPIIGVTMGSDTDLATLRPGLALLDEDMCTGCEACMTVCPVDCIHLIPGPRHEVVFQVCTIDLPRCIGCTLCHQVCPWDCITMIPTDQFLQNEKTVPQVT